MLFHAFERYVRLTGARGIPQPEEQQSDYEAGTVEIKGQRWRIRTARVTPTKLGAFVAVWERDGRGSTRPFAHDSAVQGLIVFVTDGDRFGAFHFTAADLDRLGVTRSSTKPGKRGFRVYPSWCAGLNPQAQRTQRAQAESFTVLV